MGGRRRRVHGEEGGVEGTPLTDRFSDNTGGYFEASVPLQATAFEIAKKKGVRGDGMMDPHPWHGMDYERGVGILKEWR